ncbi:AMP-binding protein [Pollutibacter soli]|uniref:AMP-binding protein n=1 Tax=Pollutibacter soli TaxID=3034157 RepID=UPI003013E261
MEHQSPLSMLYHWEKTNPDKIYLKQPVDNVWQTWTWKQTGEEVRKLASAIKALELPDGSNIALLSKNCAHWIICDLAIMMAGHVSVPLYPNSQATTIQQILGHSQAKLLFVGKLDNWHVMKEGVADDIKCIALPFCDHEECESWKSFTSASAPVQNDVKRNGDELCTIIYTSGTTGMPKGVMFTFDSFDFVAQNAIDYLSFKSSDRFFSYLPLSHIAERVLVEMISLYTGAEVSFAESLQQFPHNLREARPTVFLGVHRIWSKFQEGILTKIPQNKLNLILKTPILSAIVKRKIRKQLGLIDARLVITGASPTPVSLIEWFAKIGIAIQEAYAMTENCCYSHINPKDNIKKGFVGQPFPHCEVKLSHENEILVKHDALMKGYYKEPAKTAEVFTNDGFLKTGDEGFIDQEGFLKITGRVKDLFKTAKGKYVSPSPIEMKLLSNTDMEQVCVVGSGLPQPLAIITLSAIGKKRPSEEIDSRMKETIRIVNSHLDAHEKVYKVVIVQDEWTVENALLTPSFKIKRNLLERKYGALYSEWDNSKSMLIWQS